MRNRPAFPSLALSFLICIFTTAISGASDDESKLIAASAVLDLYFDATENQQFDRASELLLESQHYNPRARYLARQTYKQNRDLFEAYSFPQNELYGAEVKSGLLQNDTVELEGRLVASNSVQKEYKAKIVRYQKRWLIRSLDLE